MTVAELRRQTSLSQRQFAEPFDIPVRTLQQWAQGKSAPPAYVVFHDGAASVKEQWPRESGSCYASRHSLSAILARVHRPPLRPVDQLHRR